MRRVIYSLYIDIPLDECNEEYPLHGDTISKTIRTKEIFAREHQRLIKVQQAYSDYINVDYKIFTESKEYEDFYQWHRQNIPQMNTYCIVNFYKIKKLYDLAEEYDEVLYIDLDVIPMTYKNFFDAWDFNKGLVIYNNNHAINQYDTPFLLMNKGQRSPAAKFFNAQAMLIHQNCKPECDVINTAIVGGNKKYITQLNYFTNWQHTMDLMTELQTKDDGMYPENIRNMFGYDNETVFSYKLKATETPYQWLDNQWHYFYSKSPHIPFETKFCHVVNKNFEKAWKLYEQKKINF